MPDPNLRAARFLALAAFLAAGPWVVWAVFEAIELQMSIDARIIATK